MQYTIAQLTQRLKQKGYSVYEIFKNFFGEDRVSLYDMGITNLDSLMAYIGIKNIYEKDTDKQYEISDEQMSCLENEVALQSFIVYVWWPKVIVSNEYGASIDIQDLYAKVVIQRDGKIPWEEQGFSLNRATYTSSQFNCSYLHSHVASIPKENLSSFRYPCLGSGPIKKTVLSLKTDSDESLWMLFCQELSLYVTVESLSGGPYKRLEEVGYWKKDRAFPSYSFNYSTKYTFTEALSDTILKDFIKYYLLNGNLSVYFKNDCFTWGMPYYDYIIDVSNSFIEFFNINLCTKYSISNLLSSGLLRKTFVIDGKFCLKNANCFQDGTSSYQDKYVLTFKGRRITTRIIDDDSDNNSAQPVIVLCHHVAMFILEHILRTINFRYKNEYNNEEGDKQSSATAPQRCIFI